MRAQNTPAGMANIITSFAAVVFFATSAAGAPATKLSPEQIQSTFFNGQAFTAATNSNVKFKMTFSADGKMKREPAGGGGGKGEGTWKLSKEGFCSAWKGAGANCFTVVAAGDNKWSVLKGSTILATWSK
ncbi:MAG TPA: hypothetical protein VGH13_16430 [Xanthobacteraceae bacterium]